MIDNPGLKLKYEGSVKNVFADPNNTDTLWFSFTDKYSVFDWGQMPDLIKNKGLALTLIGTFIFDKLSEAKFWQDLPQSPHLQKFDSAYLQKRFAHPLFAGPNGLRLKGLPSHFSALYQAIGPRDNWQKLKAILSKQTENKYSYLDNIDINQHLLLQVLSAHVGWPELKQVLAENIYFYPPVDQAAPRRLVPLEVVFSFGLLEGSSLKRKLDEEPDYAKRLGLSSLPKVNEWFKQPTLQFFSKLESKDRLLSWQEAANISSLDAEQFEQLVELSLDVALALHALFGQSQLELWDGKLEFIFDRETNQLLLADSVGPDEVRLLYKGIHLSKEVLRQFYRPTTWYQTLPAAREIAAKNADENWQQICREQFKQSPPPLPPDLKLLVDQLYGVLTNELTAKTIFAQHPDLQSLTSQLEKTLANYKKEHVNA